LDWQTQLCTTNNIEMMLEPVSIEIIVITECI